ncbi:MAG: type II secretion system protein J, partial [Armatimonadota bacterium]
MKRRSGAFSLIELMVALTITTLLLMSTLSIITATARGLSRTQSTASMAGQARQGLEMVLYQVRGAERAEASQAISGTTFTTSATSIVLRAPAYDPATNALVIDNQWDIIAVRYDSAKRQLLQTVVPATGSKRPAGTNRVIARNVDSVDIAYTVRDVYSYKSGTTATFTLNAVPTATPVCTVNGTTRAATWNGGTGVSIAAPSSDATVQFLYRVNPASVGGTGIQAVSGVEVVLRAAETDNNGVRRTA